MQKSRLYSSFATSFLILLAVLSTVTKWPNASAGRAPRISVREKRKWPMLDQQPLLNTSIEDEQHSVYNVDFIETAGDASNKTLGFEKIFAINLPSRSDRRDVLTLAAAEYGLDIDWQDAVTGQEVSEKARPPRWDPDNPRMNMGELGCWRSHLNVLRKIVERKHQTALIVEDDVDFDVSIKTQLTILAEHLKLIPANHNAQDSVEKPYGSSWDLLWLGTCANPPAPRNAHTYYETGNEKLRVLWNVRGDVACTWAYAVTYESAKALLKWSLDIDSPYDLHLAKFCEDHACPLVWPSLFSHYDLPGGRSKASDIQKMGASDSGVERRERVESYGLKRSAVLEVLGERRLHDMR